MRLEWDEGKAEANLRKYGVDFADGPTALHDERAITVAEHVRGEQRMITIGTDALGRLLVVDALRRFVESQEGDMEDLVRRVLREELGPYVTRTKTARRPKRLKPS